MSNDAGVSVIGLGNIGAALCDLLSRLPEVKRLNLVDYGHYTEGDLCKQAITRADIGKAKSLAMARRLKRIRPDLEVITSVARVEDLPYGSLNAEVICACTDTRISRMHINERAWRLAIPWIDAGVLASQMLARVELFVPGSEAPCLECSFGESHYETMEVAHPCRAGKDASINAPSTNAQAYLGAAAASMQAAECHLIIKGKRSGLQGGEQALFDLNSHQYFLSRNRFNSNCRFDHKIYSPENMSMSESIAGVFERYGSSSGDDALFVEGRRFLRTGRCNYCGFCKPFVILAPLNSSPGWRCCGCGSWQPAHPNMLEDRINRYQIPRSIQRKSPKALGLRVGDLMCASDSQGDHWYLLGGRESGNSAERKSA